MAKLAKLANSEGTFAIIVGADDDGLYMQEQFWPKRPRQKKKRNVQEINWPDNDTQLEIINKIASHPDLDLNSLHN